MYIHNKHIKKKKNSFNNIVNIVQPLSKIKYNLMFQNNCGIKYIICIICIV